MLSLSLRSSWARVPKNGHPTRLSYKNAVSRMFPRSCSTTSELCLSPLYLGLDSSTQGLKAALIDCKLNVVAEGAVNYDEDLPQYETKGGVHQESDGTVTSPTIMFIEAIDDVLTQLSEQGVDLGQVKAVSGSGQQHGSMYWKDGASDTLANLHAADGDLATQLKDSFAIAGSPIWMDSSTKEQCDVLEDALGGPQKVADATGSRAYERFTGNQIQKLSTTGAFQETEHISLISSGLASVMAGKYVPIDYSDGAGMNLMDLRTKKWHKSACAVAAPGLEGKLGHAPIAAHSLVGKISPYFVEKYGFAPNCDTVAWSGDNPCSVAGMRLERAGDACISLGTSDTIFALLDEPSPQIEGHIFGSPLDPEGYMSLICFMNGSLVREHVREKVGAANWSEFGTLLGKTDPGNDGTVAFHYQQSEITPKVPTPITAYFDQSGSEKTKIKRQSEARAVIEARFLSMRLHAEVIGLKMERIFATGGASQNNEIVQVISNVFGCDVYTLPSPGGAAIGAAYRALHGLRSSEAEGGFVPFAEVLREAEGEDAPPHVSLAASPQADAVDTYTSMMEHFEACERATIALSEKL